MQIWGQKKAPKVENESLQVTNKTIKELEEVYKQCRNKKAKPSEVMEAKQGVYRAYVAYG
jgi:hypothetical protein